MKNIIDFKIDEDQLVATSDDGLSVHTLFEEGSEIYYVTTVTNPDDQYYEFDVEVGEESKGFFLRFDGQFVSIYDVTMQAIDAYPQIKLELDIDCALQQRHEQSFRDPRLYL